MRKLLLLLTTLFTFSAAFAQDPVVSITTVKANQGASVNQYTQSTAKALVNPNDENQSWTTYGFSNNNKGWENIRCGNKNSGANGYTATLTTDFAVSASISKVSIELARFQTGANDKITSIKLLVADDADMTNATTAAVIDDLSAFLALSKSTNSTMGTTCTYDFNISSPGSNKYYQLAFELPKTTNNGVVALLNIKYYGEVTDDAIAAPIVTLGDNNMVSISQQDNADIYYTTNGTVPTTASAKYSAPFAITATTTVKALAVLNGKESPVTTKEFKPNTVVTIAEFIELANTSDTKINTPLTAIYQCGRNLYLTDGNDFILAYNNNNNADVTALAAQNGDVISFITGTYKSQNGLPELIPSAIGSKSTGTAVEPEELTIEEIPADRLNKYVKITDVNIVAAASANNYTATDETGSIVLYNTFNSATNYPNAITLPDGTTGNTIPEGEGFTVYGFVSVYTNTQGSTLQITPIKIEGGTVMETVATPAFTPASGSELNNGDQITIECATEGARIFVAFDDEIPTAASMEYTEPLTFSENCKINAIAVKDGMLDSDVATASYTLYIEGSETATFDFTESGNIASLQTDDTFEAPASGKGVSINDINFQNGSILLSIGKGTNTTNTAQWWNYAGTNRGLECRIYTGNEMNISLVEDGYKITKITFEQNSGSTTWGNMTVTTNLGAAGTTSTSVGGVWTNSTKTYEAPASGEVNFVSFTPTANSRFAKMTVEYVVDENGVQGIEDVINDNANAPVEYYNLQGIRVNGNNLTPGIYVRRQGNEVAKVLVK